MKKICTKIMAVMIAIALAISTVVYTDSTVVQAAKGTVESVAVTNIPAKTLTLKNKKSKVLKVKVTTKGKKVSKAYIVKSSNKNVVTVKKTKKGVKVTAKKKGSAKITIKSKANAKKKTVIKVTVGTPVSSVKLNASTATLVKGGSQKLTATVAPKKVSNKKVIWTSSNDAVAKVNSNGTVTAVAAGTAKITAEAADGSGKKATCTVTVVDPVDVKDVKFIRGDVIKVTLTRAQKLTADAFTVKVKVYAAGTYNKTCKVDSMSTTDNINYYLSLNSNISKGDFVQLSIAGLEGNTSTKVFEIEYIDEPLTYSGDYILTYTYNSEIDDEIYVDGEGYSTITWTTMPAGIKAKLSDDGKYIEISGKPTVTGSFPVTVTSVDELGNTYVDKYTIIIGSSDKIVAAATPGYYATGSENNVYFYKYIDVVGGSGYYTYEIVGNNYDLKIDDHEIYGTLPAGTHNINVRVTDYYYPNLSTTCIVTINVKQSVTVSGVLKDAAGQIITDGEVYFVNKDDTNKYRYYGDAYTNEEGVFIAYIPAGTYDIQTYVGNSAADYLYDQVITKSITNLVVIANVYKVTINSNNAAIPSTSLGIWRDANDDYCGYGSYVYLKPGTHTIKSTGSSFLTEYTASATITVPNTTTVTVNIVGTSTLAGTITEDNTIYATFSSEKYYKFIPTTSGVYYFYSSNCMDDSYGELYDEYGNYLDSNDDDAENSNFLISYYCYAGETYYLAVSNYDYYTDSAYITVSKNNEYSMENKSVSVELDSAVDVYLEDYNPNYYKFVPSTSGTYYFSTEGGDYIYTSLYDVNEEYLVYDEGSYDTIMEYYCEAGETYYIVIESDYSYDECEFLITM